MDEWPKCQLGKKLMAEVHESDNNRLIDTGSCGLYVVHNAFKAGFKATTWDVKSFLCALHRIFHESPARRSLGPDVPREILPSLITRFRLWQIVLCLFLAV